MNLTLEYAKAISSHGLKVFPLRARSKVPIPGTHGVDDATDDVARIEAMWPTEDCNLAIALGELSGVDGSIFVLDTDPRAGGDSALAELEAKHGALPDTWRTLTGRGDGGGHRFFRLPPGIKLRGKIAPGLDLKHFGGYVVAPPSIHPDTGKPYLWLAAPGQVELADAPAWLLSLIERPAPVAAYVAPPMPGTAPPSAKAASAYVARMPPSISGAGGHTAAFNVARVLCQDFGLSDSDAWDVMAEFNARCQPPWSERDLKHKLESARKNARISNPKQALTRPAWQPRQARPQLPPPMDSGPDLEPDSPDASWPDAATAAQPEPPEQDLDTLLAESEGMPEDPDAAVAPDEMPIDERRRVRVGDAWRSKLLIREIKKDGTYVPVLRAVHENVNIFLTHHPDWCGVVAYDSFREAIVTLKEPPWCHEHAPQLVESGVWKDNDTDRLSGWLSRVETFDVAHQIVEAGLRVAADKNDIHPVREYLHGLKWDGMPRIDSMLTTYFGTEAGLYQSGIGARWMISAVARVFIPGCQADCTLILEGPQGIGKTSAFRALVPDSSWYADSGLDLTNKDSFDALRAIWIYGLDELDSLKRGDITRWKNFLTQNKDHYRPPYARRAKDFPRQNVFCGTTNDEEYLIDKTGNRRFWPVKVVRPIDIEAIKRNRDQLWAEAFHRQMVLDEPWHVNTEEFRKLCEAEQEHRIQQDPWETTIAEWLLEPTKPGTDGYPERVDISQGVTTTDILLYATHTRRSDMTNAMTQRVGSVLKELGYKNVVRCVENGARVRRYRK